MSPSCAAPNLSYASHLARREGALRNFLFVEGIKMKSLDRSAPPRGEQVQRVASQQRMARAGVLQCLISSASQARRNVLSKAASDAGWETTVCSAPDAALGAFQQRAFHFAMVDLDDRGDTPTGARELVQTLAQDPSKVLVGVCGHEADPDEEIWVRQQGIWLYLPGTTTSSEILQLCEHAFEVVAKQQHDHMPAP